MNEILTPQERQEIEEILGTLSLRIIFLCIVAENIDGYLNAKFQEVTA